MKFDNLLFRASSIGKIMTSARGKSEGLSETCKDYLLEVYLSEKYGRREILTSKYLDKGKAREDDSITLVSRYFKKFFKKNTVRLNNEYVTGEVDIFEGDDIYSAWHTIDTKTSWNMLTFHRSKKKLDNMYYWQGQSYMALTGAEKHTVAYCLINNTDVAIADEKKKAAYAMHILDPSARDNEEYIDKCKQIEINHIFDMQSFMNEYPWFEFDNNPNEWQWDVPLKDRLHTFTFDRNDEDIKAMYERILECRDYLKTM